MKLFYLVAILGLTALFVLGLGYTCKAQAKDAIEFSDTPCGRAMLPVVASVVATAMMASEEYKAKQIHEPWAAVLVAGEVALIEDFTKQNATIPGPYAWRQVSAMIGFVLEHTDEYAPEGKSAAMFIEAMGLAARASKVCAVEAAQSGAPKKPTKKSPSITL